MTYELIEVSPLPGALGAEISGVDMAQPLGNQLFQEVHDALLENQVIFFRDQDITPAQHVAFARQFGTLQVHPLVPHLDDHPEVPVLESKEDKRNAANAWHSDVTFSDEPPLGSILLARKRQHDVGRHVRRLRGPLPCDETLSRRHDGAASGGRRAVRKNL